MFRSFVNLIRPLLVCVAALSLESAAAQVIFPSQSLTIPSQSEPYAADAEWHGLSITLGTELLSSMVARDSVENDDVVTRVLDADVRGTKSTTTRVQLRTLENSRTGHMEIVTRGTVRSQTVGVTRQAQVSTAGTHSFDVRKPIFFDGTKFSTKSAHGSLQVRQFPQAVNTAASALPLFGPIGNQIAWNQVQRRMPAAEVHGRCDRGPN